MDVSKAFIEFNMNDYILFKSLFLPLTEFSNNGFS